MDPVTLAAGSALLGSVADFFVSGRGQDKAERQAEIDRQMQREFAQNGIQWKVADAQKAGVHPLAALGMQPASYSPVSVGSSLQSNFGAAGADIGRAVMASADRKERERTASAMAQMNAATLDGQRLANEGALIQNQILKEQLNRMRAPGTGPGIPYRVDSVSGDPLDRPVSDKQLGTYVRKPPEVSATRPGRSDVVAGPAAPAHQQYDFGWLGKWDLPSNEFAQATESIEPIAWAIEAANLAKQANAKASEKLIDPWLLPLIDRLNRERARARQIKVR